LQDLEWIPDKSLNLKSQEAQKMRIEAQKECLRMKKANPQSELAYAVRITNSHGPSLVILLKTINKGLGVTFKSIKRVSRDIENCWSRVIKCFEEFKLCFEEFKLCFKESKSYVFDARLCCCCVLGELWVVLFLIPSFVESKANVF